MTKRIFMLLSAAALFVFGTAVGWAQGLSPQVKAQLCSEKKAGLTKLEAEAPQIRAQLAQKESELETARPEMDKWDKLSIGVVAGAIPDWVRMTAKLAGMDPVAYVNREQATWANKVGPLRDEIRGLKQRQTEVGSQIFLLRDIIEGLGCGTSTPPVDYNAINQLGEQSQQSGHGATPGASSGISGGQAVQQQGSGYTAPTSGFGSSGAGTQSSGSQGQSPGYGPGPYGSGSAPFPTHQEILQGVQGSIGESPGGKSGGG